MSFIGDFIIGFFGEALASSPTLQRVCLWILFSISVLLTLVPVMTGEYAWSIIPISIMLFSVVTIDGTREQCVKNTKNGGAYHYFLLTVGTLCVAAIVLLAALSLAGVPQVALTPQAGGINFAPWYVAVSALVLLLFFYNAAAPNEEIPNLRRMERINRYVRLVVLGVSALMALFCLLIPVVSFATAGYEPVGVSVVLCLVPVFLILCAAPCSSCGRRPLRRALPGTACCVASASPWWVWVDAWRRPVLPWMLCSLVAACRWCMWCR